MLHIADRAGFLGFSKKAGGKYACVKSMVFDDQYLPTVISKLFEADRLPQEVAINILDKELPELIHAEYKENPNVAQSRFKGGMCYIANPKALLRNEFDKHFGAIPGKDKYKEFTLFMRSEALKDYESTHSTEDNAELRKVAGEILAKKRKGGGLSM